MSVQITLTFASAEEARAALDKLCLTATPAARPPVEPKVTVPSETARAPKPEPEQKAAKPAEEPAGVPATPAKADATAGSSGVDRAKLSSDVVELAKLDRDRALAVLQPYGVTKARELNDEQAADAHPKILAALAEARKG